MYVETCPTNGDSWLNCPTIFASLYLRDIHALFLCITQLINISFSRYMLWVWLGRNLLGWRGACVLQPFFFLSFLPCKTMTTVYPFHGLGHIWVLRIGGLKLGSCFLLITTWFTLNHLEVQRLLQLYHVFQFTWNHCLKFVNFVWGGAQISELCRPVYIPRKISLLSLSLSLS